MFELRLIFFWRLKNWYEIRKAIRINHEENLDVCLGNSNIYLRDIFWFGAIVPNAFLPFSNELNLLQSILHTLPGYSGFISTSPVMALKSLLVSVKVEEQVGKELDVLLMITCGQTWLQTKWPRMYLEWLISFSEIVFLDQILHSNYSIIFVVLVLQGLCSCFTILEIIP